MKKLLFSLLFFLTLNSFIRAQSPTHLFVLGTSANAYKGDLSDTYHKWSASVHLGMKINKGKRINGLINLSFGNVTGQNPNFEGNDEIEGTPNRFFNTKIFTANYDLQLNLLKRKQFTVFISQGIGLLFYTPQDEFKEKFTEPTRAPNETYSNSALTLPSQLGVNYFFKNGYGLGLQAGYLNPISDYIDNISELGDAQGNDNVFMGRAYLMIPLKLSKPVD
ncbi:hypothetical protein [Xanthovirga aplysinae]|uniref:hypothetical protein n=1 Tax=Xanthovirga aplysinae TaxID=2529853 RepID=UPI0012BC3306|nr:hypothetical protein [Xanthovirga aplysinae]MTI33605.1 hypothetical protein [Xanthovirga aplysinae]